MDLRTYIKGLGDEPARVKFATACGTTVGHLRNVMGGHSSCSAALARSIEHQSDGVVKRWTLRPTDWWVIWPELLKDKCAPKVPGQSNRRLRRAAALEA